MLPNGLKFLIFKLLFFLFFLLLFLFLSLVASDPVIVCDFVLLELLELFDVDFVDGFSKVVEEPEHLT